MRTAIGSLGLGLLVAWFASAFAGLAIAMAYGGGLRGAQRLSESEKGACELLGWGLGALLGAFVGSRIRPLTPSLVLLFGVALYLVNGSYFAWQPMSPSFWVGGVLAIVAGTVTGAALGNRRELRGA